MKLLTEMKLENDLSLSFYDESRQVAGDRWHVNLKIVGSMPLSEMMLAEINNEENSSYLLDHLNGSLSFEIERQRHFVDEKCRQEILDELLTAAQKNILEYVSKPKFLQQLLNKRIQALSKQHIIDAAILENSNDQHELSEPEDFSACFK